MMMNRDEKAAMVNLYVHLQDRLESTRCGCKHPACSKCGDDAMDSAALRVAEPVIAGMHRDGERGPSEIEREIRETRAHMERLTQDLEQAREREAEAAVSALDKAAVCRVWERFQAGWWVSGPPPRVWWNRENEPLVEQVSLEDLDAIEHLRQTGALESAVRIWRG